MLETEELQPGSESAKITVFLELVFGKTHNRNLSLTVVDAKLETSKDLISSEGPLSASKRMPSSSALIHMIEAAAGSLNYALERH